VAVLGHKADVALMVLGRDVVAAAVVPDGGGGGGLTVVDSYVSITELSEYAQGLPEPWPRPASTRSCRPRA
jgi:peroxiredoxin